MSIALGNINLFVRDIARAREFYVTLLGLTEDTERSAPPDFVLIQAGSVTLTLQNEKADGAAFGSAESIEIGFAVDDVQAIYDKLSTAGVEVSGLQTMGWGSGFDARDPDRHRLTFYTMR